MFPYVPPFYVPEHFNLNCTEDQTYSSSETFDILCKTCCLCFFCLIHPCEGMPMSKSSLFWPLCLIAIGSVWLMSVTDILPPTSTLFAAALFAAGVLNLFLERFRRSSWVSGPFLMYCGFAVYAYYHDIFGRSVAVATGMIVLGLLMMIERMVPEQKETSVQEL